MGLVAAWVTAAAYLGVRLGKPSPLPLGVIDATHAYAGLAFALAVLAKTSSVGLRSRVKGLTGLTSWDRWISRGTAVLYLAVVITGVAAALPLAEPARTELADAHLIAAVWAAVPSSIHVAHYARRVLQLARAKGPRLAGAVLAVVVIGTGVAAFPRSVSSLALTGAGSTWRATGPATFLDRLAVTPDGHHLLTGGAGLWVADLRGGKVGPWRAIGPFNNHDLVLGMASPLGRWPVAIGASDGVWVASTPTGRLTHLALPVHEVHALVATAGSLWVSSAEGIWRSADQGTSWTSVSEGLTDPTTAWSLASHAGSTWASDAFGVYRWGGQRWIKTSSQQSVVSLDSMVGGPLFSASMGQGLQTAGGASWAASQAGIPNHDHGGVSGTHVVSVTVGPGPIRYAGTMLDGAAVSRDAGRSWTLPWPSLVGKGAVWRVLPVGRSLVAATDAGLLSYQLPSTRTASPLWWAGILVASIIAGLALISPAIRRRSSS